MMVAGPGRAGFNRLGPGAVSPAGETRSTQIDTIMADPSLLEVFPNPHPQRNYLIVHTTREFTSLCPVTSQPDYATLHFRFVAAELCIELRSLKRYLQSYRNDGVYYEDVTNRILDDVVARCRPLWMEVESRWRLRGGIETTISARHGDPGVVPVRPTWVDPSQDRL